MLFFQFCSAALLFFIVSLPIREVASLTDDDLLFQDMAVIKLQHSLDSRDQFSPLGTVTIRSLKEGSPTVDLHSKDVFHGIYQKDPNEDDLYKVAIEERGRKLVTSWPLCPLIHSRFRFDLYLYYDVMGNLIGAHVRPDEFFAAAEFIRCPKGAAEAAGLVTSPHITVKLRPSQPVPLPDTQAYLDKLEREKLAKAKTAEQDNRSFLSKYWMYIVPVVIVLFVMQSADPGQR